jgi:hypothetical protein
MIDFAEYPNLRAAAIHIMYDNGMVNRLVTEEVELSRVAHDLELTYETEQLRQVEGELGRLGPAALELACTGGQDEPDKVAISPLADAMLDVIFEGPPDDAPEPESRAVPQ